MALSIDFRIFPVYNKEIFIDLRIKIVYNKSKGGDSVGVSASIKALLVLSGLKQADLVQPLNMGSRQSLNNKFSNERWSAQDLVDISRVCGGKLAFILPNGQQIIVESDSH